MQVKLYEDQIKASVGYGAIAKMADLLMANLHLCEPGASSVTVSVFFNTHLFRSVNYSGSDRDPLISISDEIHNRWIWYSTNVE